MWDTDAQQVELGTAIPPAPEVLQPVDLALDLPAAPGRIEGGAHGWQAGFEPGGEALQVEGQINFAAIDGAFALKQQHGLQVDDI